MRQWVKSGTVPTCNGTRRVQSLKGVGTVPTCDGTSIGASLLKAMGGSVSDLYSLNLDPDPATNLNPDPDPGYFLTLSEYKYL